MIIIGCDYHPSFQQIAFVDTETGEFQEQRLAHREEAEKCYRDLAARGGKLRVGMEASGQARWFERLLAELNVELWIGDAAEIRAKRVRKKKTDREDARHILRLLLEDRFPRIWVPSWDNRDVRQLLWHRHRMVQMRTRIMNQLQAVALNEGLCCKKRLWREKGRKQLEAFPLAPWASRRRRDLLELLDRMNPTIAELTQVNRTGSGKISCGTTTDDPSRSGCPDGAGLRADHRRGGAVWVRQADRELCGSGTRRRLQWRTTPAGTYQQARQRFTALLSGGSGAGDSTERSRVAEQVFPSRHATRTQDRQGGNGAPTGGSSVLDVAPAMGLRAVEKVRSARGPARNRRCCATKHRVIDWAARSPSPGSSN